MNLLYILMLVLALLLSFLLSGMEAGVFALNRLRVRRLARAGKSSAKVLNGFLEKPERFLWTILVGNTLANFLILGFTLAKIHEWFIGNTILIAAIFGAVVFLFYTFFDLLPKMLFRAFPNQLCLSAAQVFRPVNFVLSLFVSVVEGVSQAILWTTGKQAFTGKLFGNREEMRAVMHESAAAFTRDEHAMINRILDLQKFTVGQIARPIAQIISVESRTPLAEAFKIAREQKYSRLPLWEIREGKSRVAGLLPVGALLFRDDLDFQKPAAAHMTPALFLGEDTRLEIAFRKMQRAGERMVVVLSRDGKEVGVVTLEDILKIMFGEVKL